MEKNQCLKKLLEENKASMFDKNLDTWALDIEERKNDDDILNNLESNSIFEQTHSQTFDEEKFTVKKESIEDYNEINPLDFVEVQEEEEDSELMCAKCEGGSAIDDVSLAEHNESSAIPSLNRECGDEDGWMVRSFDSSEFSPPSPSSNDDEEDSKLLRCSECDKAFSDLRHLENHKALYHVDLKPFHCYECSKIFVLKRSLKIHFVSKHHVLGPHECFECASNFDSEKTLKEHVDSDHFRPKPFHCVECNINYNRRDILKSHFDAVHTKLETFKCGICGSGFAEKWKLRHHISFSHRNIKPFECPKCDSKFSRPHDLKGHLETVHCVGRPFKCSLCDYCFSLEALLKRHVDSVHENVKPIQCPYCDKRFSIRKTLFKHVRSAHECQSLPSKCPKCDVFFADKKTANEHFQTSECGASKIRPYQCHECSATFTQRAHLYTHRKSVHTAPKGLKCQLCDVCFSYKNSLNRHLVRVHELDPRALKAHNNRESKRAKMRH